MLLLFFLKGDTMKKSKSETKQEDGIILTKKAAEKILEISKQEKKEGNGLKLFVFPGGCAGFQYGMDFEESPEKTDIIVEQHGVKLFVDKDSIDFLKGTKIDYVDSLKGSGFKIDNPNVTKTCSCGNSVC